MAKGLFLKRKIKKMKAILKQKDYENLTETDIKEINSKRRLYNRYNCYGFAVYGFKLKDVKKVHGKKLYLLGFSTKKGFNNCKTEEKAKELLMKDMNLMNIKVREVTANEKADSGKGETKIAFYLLKSKKHGFGLIPSSVYDDFHFLRQDSTTGVWYHKQGFTSPILRFDGSPKKILTTRVGDYVLNNYFIIENLNKANDNLKNVSTENINLGK